jgi:16S rRNA (cytosine967-C5)-methyltransferase
MSVAPGVALRVLATRTLDAVLQRGRSLKAELAAALPQLADVRDRALLEAIAFTALRGRARYDAALQAWMPKPLARRDAELRALLHAGFAQIEMQLPPHAAVDATVGAARALGRTHQAGLVNALLRRALRDGLPDADPAAAWPGWLLARLRRDWPQQADGIVAASAQPAPLWLRANVRRTSRDALLLQLEGLGIHATAGALASEAIRIDEPLAIASLHGFTAGEFSVQDASAQLVADALSPAPGARVLDACAAPGGKAAHLLERDPSLRLTALDIDAARLRKVRDNFARLGVGETATLHVADAADTDAWWGGERFDAILLDAPCTATGVVRRQPDVLLHRRESDLAPLLATQARLLDACWSLLAPGGVLLYATCSILAEENAQQIDAFLARAADAKTEMLDTRFGQASGAGRQRFPGDDGTDGFFYARLRKTDVVGAKTTH